MHTSNDFSLDQTQKHLHIEEETHMYEKNMDGVSTSKMNNVESCENWGNKRKSFWVLLQL